MVIRGHSYVVLVKIPRRVVLIEDGSSQSVYIGSVTDHVTTGPKTSRLVSCWCVLPDMYMNELIEGEQRKYSCPGP